MVLCVKNSFLIFAVLSVTVHNRQGGVAATENTCCGIDTCVYVDWFIGNLASQNDIMISVANSRGFQPFAYSSYFLDSVLLFMYLGSAGRTTTQLDKYYFTSDLHDSVVPRNATPNLRPHHTFYASTDLVQRGGQAFTEFVQRLYKIYGKLKLVVSTFNDHTYKLINDDMIKATRGLITNYLTPTNFSPSSQGLFVSNALYDGKWRRPFREKSLNPEWQIGGPLAIFYAVRADGERYIQTDVYYMEAEFPCTDTFCYGFLQTSVAGLTSDVIVLEIPITPSCPDYNEAVVIFMPLDPAVYIQMLYLIDTVPDFINTLIQEMEENKPNLIGSVFSVRIPYWEISDTETGDFVPAVKALGVEDLFDSSADLSGIDSVRDLRLNTIPSKKSISISNTQLVGAIAVGGNLASISGSMNGQYEGTFTSILKRCGGYRFCESTTDSGDGVNKIEVNINSAFYYETRARYADAKVDKVLCLGGINEIKSLQQHIEQ